MINRLQQRLPYLVISIVSILVIYTTLGINDLKENQEWIKWAIIISMSVCWIIVMVNTARSNRERKLE